MRDFSYRSYWDFPFFFLETERFTKLPSFHSPLLTFRYDLNHLYSQLWLNATKLRAAPRGRFLHESKLSAR